MTVKLVVTVQMPDAGDAHQFAPDVSLAALARALHAAGFTHQGRGQVVLLIHDDGVVSAATSPDDHRLVYSPPRSKSMDEALHGKQLELNETT